MDQEKELVLTGTEALLPQNPDQAVFLAPWCFFNNSRYSLWQNRSETILPNPYDNGFRSRPESMKKLTQLLDRLWEPLTKYCNQQTESNHSTKYWQTIFGHWLLEFVSVLQERWTRLEQAQIILSRDKVTIKIAGDLKMQPKDYYQYYHWMSQHDYNLFLLSDIVRFMKPLNWKVIEVSNIDFSTMKKYQHSARATQKLSTGLVNKKSWMKIIKAWVKSLDLRPDIYLGNIHNLNDREKGSLKWNMKHLAKLGFSPSLKSITSPKTLNYSPLPFSSDNKFEEFLAAKLTSYLPINHVQNIQFQSGTKIKTYIGNDIYDFPKKSLLGEVRENQGQWISVQHGGGYGILEDLTLGYLEYQTADAFITWGWKHQDIFRSGNFIDLPSPYLSKLKASFKKLSELESNRRIFYITTAVPIYTYRFDRVASPELQLQYFKNLKTFFQQLAPALSENIYIKSYHHDFLFDEITFFESFHPPAKVIKNSPPMGEMYAQTKLVIIDHIGTSFLETLALNIPTLLVVDENIYRPLNTAKIDLELLRVVGIYHTSVSSAVTTFTEIHANIDSWWQNPERQRAIREFCHRHARTSPDWEKEWEKKLLELTT